MDTMRETAAESFDFVGRVKPDKRLAKTAHMSCKSSHKNTHRLVLKTSSPVKYSSIHAIKTGTEFDMTPFPRCSFFSLNVYNLQTGRANVAFDYYVMTLSLLTSCL